MHDGWMPCFTVPCFPGSLARMAKRLARPRIFALAPADYAELFAQWKSTPGIGIGPSDERAAVTRFLRRNKGLSVAVRDKGRIVASVLCGHDGRRGFLYHLVVIEAYRRLGLGTMLVEECMGRLRRAGIEKCNIVVFADNKSGERFWRTCDFGPRPDLKLLQRRV
jgi:N-acetylglutamate synthase